MRRHEKEIKDPKVVRDILRDALFCRIALVDGSRPYVVPMCFALDGDDLLLHSAKAGRKIAIIARNPSVCFEVESGVSLVTVGEVCDWGVKYQSVIGFGEASIEPPGVSTSRAIQIIAAKYAGRTQPKVRQESVEKTLVIRVAIKELHGKQSGQ
jgi:uncharacterized protein